MISALGQVYAARRSSPTRICDGLCDGIIRIVVWIDTKDKVVRAVRSGTCVCVPNKCSGRARVVVDTSWAIALIINTVWNASSSTLIFSTNNDWKTVAEVWVVHQFAKTRTAVRCAGTDDLPAESHAVRTIRSQKNGAAVHHVRFDGGGGW